MKRAPALVLLALAAALMVPASPAFAQIELTEADPPDGARLDAPPGETAAPEETLQPASPIGQEAGDDGPDILFLALITAASAGGAALLFTLGYLLRRRIGYEPHRPPEGEEEGEGH